jgi:hypothetical protein
MDEEMNGDANEASRYSSTRLNLEMNEKAHSSNSHPRAR